MSRRKKWGLAMLVACPSCAIGFVFVMAALFGVTAAAVKGSLLGIGATVLAFFWIRNAWRRREEGACRLPDVTDPVGDASVAPDLQPCVAEFDGIDGAPAPTRQPSANVGTEVENGVRMSPLVTGSLASSGYE